MLGYFTYRNSIIEVVKLTKSTADFDKYNVLGYLIEFDTGGRFSLSDDSGFGKNVLILGADKSSSLHFGNRKKVFLVKVRHNGQTILHWPYRKNMLQVLVSNKKKCLNLHYKGANSYLLVNGVQIYKFTAKDFEINAPTLCVRNVLKGFSGDIMKKTGLYRYVHDFSVDYCTTDVADILDIYRQWTSMAQKNRLVVHFL